ncbi:hypothetical protein H072_334 [Dactylellina haptotyla CBS 200.50]|uniref:Uncharacterized protein n=1 Tax=Dactylellina haptotyla (strain CBS 200.50) TaxID=1284197 RepID=S8ARR7_DACHA|nr:hypothetical protein H072_334 [Dactylellina haptotyla CBS 200.50]
MMKIIFNTLLILLSFLLQSSDAAALPNAKVTDCTCCTPAPTTIFVAPTEAVTVTSPTTYTVYVQTLYVYRSTTLSARTVTVTTTEYDWSTVAITSHTFVDTKYVTYTLTAQPPSNGKRAIGAPGNYPLEVRGDPATVTNLSPSTCPCVNPACPNETTITDVRSAMTRIVVTRFTVSATLTTSVTIFPSLVPVVISKTETISEENLTTYVDPVIMTTMVVVRTTVTAVS